jgi:DNA repair exonuclease SbcCD nuclease subunit
MKIVHMADSHLGFSAYGRFDDRGRNLREENIYKGFDKTVDKIIELRPDAVVHSGDVFHYVRPRIKPLYVFKRALERLKEKGIPVVLISGNHDAPKNYVAYSPFTLYETGDKRREVRGTEPVKIAHRNRYESFEVGDHIFHCIPFCLNPEDYQKEFAKIRFTGRDVLVMHGLIEALWHRRLRTVGEHELKESFLKSDFSYIALGHYHDQAKIAQNAWYSGSVEYFRFSEAKDKKGILSVDLEHGSVDRVEIQEQYMFDPEPIDCDGLATEEILTLILTQCEKLGIEEKIVRIRLKDVAREAYRGVDPKVMGELKRRALHLEILPEFKEEKCEWEIESMDSAQLPQEFKRFIEMEASRDSIPTSIKGDVISYGTELMARISEKRTMESFDASQ